MRSTIAVTLALMIGKEVIGGVVILETDTLDEAVEMASTWPLGAGMNALEVRPVLVRE